MVLDRSATLAVGSRCVPPLLPSAGCQGSLRLGRTIGSSARASGPTGASPAQRQPGGGAGLPVGVLPGRGLASVEGPWLDRAQTVLRYHRDSKHDRLQHCAQTIQDRRRIIDCLSTPTANLTPTAGQPIVSWGTGRVASILWGRQGRALPLTHASCARRPSERRDCDTLAVCEPILRWPL